MPSFIILQQSTHMQAPFISVFKHTHTPPKFTPVIPLLSLSVLLAKFILSYRGRCPVELQLSFGNFKGLVLPSLSGRAFAAPSSYSPPTITSEHNAVGWNKNTVALVSVSLCLSMPDWDRGCVRDSHCSNTAKTKGGEVFGGGEWWRYRERIDECARHRHPKN